MNRRTVLDMPDVTSYLIRFQGWTEERFLQEAPEDAFWEYEDGDVIVHSPVGTTHQRIVRFLTILIGTYVRFRGLGDVLTGPAVVRLRPGLDYEPDIFFVGADQMDHLGETYLEGPPRWVVEVASPSTRRYDLETKARNYERYGVAEYWVIDPEGRVVVQHVSVGRRYRRRRVRRGRLESRVVAGFWIDVGWLWQDPLPDEWTCLQSILGPHRPSGM